MRQQGYRVFHELSQKVSEAIHSVTGIDVTIMDAYKRRIAGTGMYRGMVNQGIEDNTAFDCCLQKGEVYVIAEPKKNPVCLYCARRHTCSEKAEICVPIPYKNSIIGVIGIIAFNDEQRDKMILNKDIYLNFTQKMASLLEGKYAEIQIGREKQKLSRRMDSILNTIPEALIVFGPEGGLIYKNRALDDLLKEIGASDVDDILEQIWKQIKIKSYKHLDSDIDVDINEIEIHHGGKIAHLLSSLSIMKGEEDTVEFIITLQNLKRIEKKVIQSAERNQIQMRFEDILGLSANLEDVKKTAKKAAYSQANILITGESGTGKEMFARAIHNESERCDHPFIPINCGAIPDELLESELFGHEKGAFTGALNTKLGKFEVAENGTIFLDEISEMPYHLQVKMLRVLQEKEICRIGSNTIRKVNIRFIAASNRDLLQMVRNGTFREDLYYRLNIIPINIPPLRERKEDILYIAGHFLKYYAGMMDKKVISIAEDVKKILLKYSWPGNVRELQNIMEYAVSLETGSEIGQELITKRLNLQDDPWEGLQPVFTAEHSLKSFVESSERCAIEEMLRIHQNNKDKIHLVCRDLRISRATFYRKCKELDISLL